MNKLINYLAGLSLIVFSITSCKEQAIPPKENPEEIIDKITLIFNRTDNQGVPVTVTARDADGAGPDSMKADGPIVLIDSTSYDLFISFENTLVNGNVSDTIQKTGDEHMIFFQFTPNVFSSPVGNGNVDNRNDPMNYLDKDSNGLPIGLITSWITGTPGAKGTFEIILKHQPGEKSATSTAQTGETDVQFTWDIEIQ